VKREAMLLLELEDCDELLLSHYLLQPTLEQVPPKVPLFSTQTVFNPSWADLMAAT